MEGQQALPDIRIQVPGSELESNQPDCHSAPRWQIQQPFTIKSKRMDMHENAVWQCQSTEDEERILRQKSYFFIMPGDGCHAMECHPEGKAALLLTGAWRLSFF